ncbi:hypothetical protein [Rubripirellula reticaptiva]|uniref:Uncharacterized protein n=1 Tax=Rubripirellula reticaptiva TaxID=2528013 RepID=A0A5C6F5U1_9BACT|nr:hypothetical protein [Rubripirellula reticaptiva]TWU55894.1 hypothetical protein Poly59_21970 [Rubripirellula reticaptiva]
MLMLPTTANSPLANPAYDRGAVSLIPLDEPTAYKQLDAYFERESCKRSLCEAAGIDDGDLIDRLADAGFTSDTLSALQLAPIALVAWASDSVSDEESQAAVRSIYKNRLFAQPAAASRVQSWLDVRPDESLRDLWVDYTECRLQSSPFVVRLYLWANVTTAQNRKVCPGQHHDIQDRVVHRTEQVALASGGCFGFGMICMGEQSVIDRVREIVQHSPR